MFKMHLLLGLILVFMINCSKRNEFSRIDVYFINPMIETPYCISNNEFDKMFRTSISRRIITSPKIITEFEDEINKIEYANNMIYQYPNARIKLILRGVKGYDTMFIGQRYLSYHDKYYLLHPAFKKVLYDQIGYKELVGN